MNESDFAIDHTIGSLTFLSIRMHFASLFLPQEGFSCNVIATVAQVKWHFKTAFIYGVLLNASCFFCCL